ncbi:MAG TPA: DUF885 family protein [Methylomirabilota bacterium]|nr:DUF885 family protein [Methylomirabilota bacterium]
MTKNAAIAVAAALWIIPCALALGGQADGDGYGALVALNEEFLDFREPATIDGFPDVSRERMEAQAKGLSAFFDRLAAIDPDGWTVPEKVDYLLVRAQLNDLDFRHRVLRPWARDPGVYVSAVQRVAFTELPASGDELAELEARLQTVPAFLDRAKANLTEGAGELCRTALRDLEQADGVGHGHPYREVPPAGTIGWYRDLIGRLQQHHPELVPTAEAALEAVIGFRDWLEASKMDAPAGVGREHYDWYLKNVLYMPYTVDDIIAVGERELHRSRAFLELERNKNRDVPVLEPAASADDYHARIREADEQIRRFIHEEGILTIPDYVGELDFNVPWIERPDGRRNFWEEIQYRDPRPDHVHAVIPGHRFDMLVKERDERPIRGPYYDSGRIEGWALYLEEMFLQAGLLDELPRTRELFYIFQIARAVRNRAEVGLHTNEYTIEEAARFMVDRTPMMEASVARVDAEIYLREPGYGISYQMGKIQIEQLMADRAMQLGARFSLKDFHDRFLAAGMIPISLIRWEMTGFDDEVNRFWD